jgi:predicted PurR-regulated permease PerM
MTAPASPLRPYRFFVMLSGIVLVTAVLYWAQKILIPLALAILLAFVLNPVVAFLQRRGLWRVPSVILVVCLAFLVLGGIGMMLMLQAKQLAADLPKYKDNLVMKMAGLRSVGKGPWLRGLQEMEKEITEGNSKDKQPSEGSGGEPTAPRIEPAGSLSFERFAAPTLEIVATSILVVVLLIFMLIQREQLRNRMVQLIGHGRLIHTTRAFEEAARRLSRFLLMQFVVNAGFGVVLGVALFLIGVPYPLLWGTLAATLRFVPYVGTMLTMALVLLFSLAITPTWTVPLLVLVLLVVMELSTANIVEPLLFRHSTGVSPIALLVGAAFWTWLWGPIGLVLSTPLTACLVVLGRYAPRLEFLGVLLGDKSVIEPEITYYQRLLARDQDEATDVVNEYLRTHPPETVYDKVLVPALVLAKRDRNSGDLSAEDERFIYQVTEEILVDFAFTPRKPAGLAEATLEATPKLAGPKVLILACPACDEADELTLKMLRRLLDPAGSEVEVLSGQDARGTGRFARQGDSPAVVCVAALPPGGLAQARYLCKRLRASFPAVKIVVVRWGLLENAERRQQELLSAGADFVAAILLEAQTQVSPLVSVLAHVEEARAAVA